jgi:hypothetical protein
MFLWTKRPSFSRFGDSIGSDRDGTVLHGQALQVSGGKAISTEIACPVEPRLAFWV